MVWRLWQVPMGESQSMSSFSVSFGNRGPRGMGGLLSEPGGKPDLCGTRVGEDSRSKTPSGLGSRGGDGGPAAVF